MGMFLNFFIRQNVPIALNFSVEFHKKRIYFVLSLTSLSVLRGSSLGEMLLKILFLRIG